MPVLDTSFLVDLIRGKNDALTSLSRLEGDKALCTTVMNALELYRGAYLTQKPRENVIKIERILSALTILSIDNPVYITFGALSASLKSEGMPIGDFDTVVASIALCYDGKIVTKDIHFSKVTGLEIIDY